MRDHDLFIGGPLHGYGRPAGSKPARTYAAEDDKGQVFQYRIVSLVIGGQPRDVFVAEGFDLERAKSEAARFASAFRRSA